MGTWGPPDPPPKKAPFWGGPGAQNQVPGQYPPERPPGPTIRVRRPDGLQKRGNVMWYAPMSCCVTLRLSILALGIFQGFLQKNA